MANPNMKKGMRLGGRAKGVQNKVTTSVKEAFVEAFEKMGGAEALVRWGLRNPSEFYKLVSKLIPHDITSDGKGVAITLLKLGDDPQILQQISDLQIRPLTDNK